MVTSPLRATDLGLLMAAIPTPMDDQEQIRYDLFEPLIEEHIDRGVEGIYCGGSSGEGLLLSLDERRQVVRAAVRAASGRVPVIAHVGALRTQDSIELARAAELDGAVAVSMIPPIFYTYSPAEIVEHYRQVMDAIGLPMVLYNIPQFTGTEFTADSASELLADPRVIGVKQTSHNMFALERMTAAYPGKAYINGFDEVFLSALAAGATGTIGTTVGLQIELFKAIRKRFVSGDLAGAQRVQRQVNAVIEQLVSVSVFPAAKYLTGRRIGSLGPCRSPFRRLTAAETAQLDALGDRIDNYIKESQAEDKPPPSPR